MSFRQNSGGLYLACCIIGSFLTSNALAGDYAAAEQGGGVEQSLPQNHALKPLSRNQQHEQEPAFTADLLESLFAMIAAGGASSLAQVSPATADEQQQTQHPRELGEPLIPFIRLDYSGRNSEQVMAAADYRYEFGYGPIAIHINKTRFVEATTQSEMDLTRIFALYRMFFASNVELGIGVGKLQGPGNHTQLLTSFPLLIHFDNHLGIEFRPAFSRDSEDYDLALLYDFSYLSLKAGYRRIATNNDSTSFNRPYAGLALHF